jgi:hypothetical protein
MNNVYIKSAMMSHIFVNLPASQLGTPINMGKGGVLPLEWDILAQPMFGKRNLYQLPTILVA